MKNSEKKIMTSRREAMKLLAAGGTAGLLGLLGSPLAGQKNMKLLLMQKGWLL